ncbi:hypothetical protein [Haloarcula litorea]|uniref:hypothetical protein n=1 Tax=Haloarcula litorea TaxID=3032579 RepID=UPI0023E7F0AF|nr:hypothetical protein [Halomicroarcula sp. GDY20]
MILGFDEDAFKKSVGVVFAVLLLVGFVPIIGDLIRLVPTMKEIALGAVVVAMFTSIADTTEGIKFALVTGMIAAVLFNLVYIPAQFVLGGLLSATGGTEGAAGMAMMAGFGALTNLVGLVFFSPVGYTIGGVIGAYLNED